MKGAVFVFEKSGQDWVSVANLVPSDAHSSDRIGMSIAIQDDLILVGSPAHDDEFENDGAIYVFKKINGT